MRKRSGQVYSRESSATLQLTVSLLYQIEYYTIANQKQARYNIDKKTKATATVQKIDFGCSHKEQIENRYPQWLKTLVCSAWRKLFE